MEKIIITIGPKGHVSVECQGTSNLSREIMEKVCNVLDKMEYAMRVNTFAEKHTKGLEIMLGL